MKGRRIEWKPVIIPSSTQKIAIQSNKHEDIKIQRTDKTDEKMMSEDAKDILGIMKDGFFRGTGNVIKENWRNDGHIYENILSGVAGTVSAALISIIPIHPIAYAVDVIRQNQIDKNLSNKKECNIDITDFNAYLKEIKDLETRILSKRHELKEQEEKLNSYSFALERILNCSNKSKVVVVIGPTGFGKSLVCNRLLGNKQDIDDIEDSKTCDFKVSQTGDTESHTTELSKKEKHIIINENGIETSFMLSVIDTPGAFDSKGSDDEYNNLMSHYFAACGGINVFCIFFKFGGKMDSKYKHLLTLYQKFWGSDIWKHCVVFITHCDMANITAKRRKKILDGLVKTKNQIKMHLETVSDMNCENIPMYAFGTENYEESTTNFLSSLMNENNPYFYKYECQSIKTPINELYEELKVMVRKHKTLSSKIEAKVDILKKKKDVIWDDSNSTQNPVLSETKSTIRNFCYVFPLSFLSLK